MITMKRLQWMVQLSPIGNPYHLHPKRITMQKINEVTKHYGRQNSQTYIFRMKADGYKQQEISDLTMKNARFKNAYERDEAWDKLRCLCDKIIQGDVARLCASCEKREQRREQDILKYFGDDKGG